MTTAAMPEGFECWSVRIGDCEFLTDPSDMYPQVMLAHFMQDPSARLTVKVLHDDRLIVAKNDCAIHPWGKDAPQESFEVSHRTAEYFWNLQYLRGDGLRYERADCLKNIAAGKHPSRLTEHHWPGAWSWHYMEALTGKDKALDERVYAAAVISWQHKALHQYLETLCRLTREHDKPDADVEALMVQFVEDYKQGVIDGWIRGWETYEIEVYAETMVFTIAFDLEGPWDLNVPRAATQSKKKLAEFRKQEKLEEAANGYLPPKA